MTQRINEDLLVSGSVAWERLPETHVYNVLAGTTVLDVANKTTIKLQSAVPVTITEFKHGQEGQSLAILGDGNSTYAGVLLTANKIYRYTYIGGTWYPDI